MTFLLRYWPYLVAAVALVTLGIWLGGIAPKADLATEQKERAQERAEWEKASRLASDRALQRQKDLQLAADTARGDLADALSRIREQDARIARLDVDAVGMRNKLAAYASGAGSTDSLAACQARAGALANLLAESSGLLVSGTGLVRQAAIAHDERAAEVKALLQAWPMNRHAEDSQPR